MGRSRSKHVRRKCLRLPLFLRSSRHIPGRLSWVGAEFELSRRLACSRFDPTILRICSLAARLCADIPALFPGYQFRVLGRDHCSFQSLASLYAVIIPGHSRLYIGSTVSSCLERYKQHVRDARFVQRGSCRDRFHKALLLCWVPSVFGSSFFLCRLPPGSHVIGSPAREHLILTLRALENELIVRANSLDHGFNSRVNFAASIPLLRPPISHGHIPSARSSVPSLSFVSSPSLVFPSVCLSALLSAHVRLLVNGIFSQRNLEALRSQKLDSLVREADSHIRHGSLSRTRRQHFLQIRQRGFAILRSRVRATSRVAFLRQPLFLVPFSRSIEGLDLRRIILSPEFLEFLPVRVRLCLRESPPCVVYSYNPPLRNLVQNNTFAGSSDTELARIRSSPCRCTSLRYRDFLDPTLGHVWTTNSDVASDPAVRHLLSLPSGFRLPPSFSLDLVFQSIDSLASSFIRSFGISAYELVGWRLMLKQYVRKRLLDSSVSDQHECDPLFSDSVRTALRLFQRDFCVTILDKVPGQFAFVCKKLFLSLLDSQLASGQFSHVVDRSATSIFDEHEHFLSTRCIPRLGPFRSRSKLRASKPKLYIKMHKSTPSVRCISACAGSTLTPLSKLLTSIFRAMLPGYRDIWNLLLVGAGLPRRGFLFISSTSEFVSAISCLNREFRGVLPLDCTLSTFDFSTLYDSIPLGDLEHRILGVIGMVFRHQRGLKQRYLIASPACSFCRLLSLVSFVRLSLLYLSVMCRCSFRFFCVTVLCITAHRFISKVLVFPRALAVVCTSPTFISLRMSTSFLRI